MDEDVEVYQVAPYSKKDKLIKVDKKNYFKDVDIKYFTVPELQKLLNGAKNQYHRLIYTLLYETGGRIEEVRSLRFKDLDTSVNRLKIKTLKQRRSGDVYRFIYLSDRLVSMILAHRVDSSLTDTDFIMAKKPGRNPIIREAVTRALKLDVINTLGKDYLDKAHPHAFRHSRAIHMLDAGIGITTVQSFLGHRNIINTVIYLRHSHNDMAEAIKSKMPVFY